MFDPTEHPIFTRGPDNRSCIMRQLTLFLDSKIVFQHRFLLLASVGSVIGRLKRMYQSPIPKQTPCTIQNIYTG